MVTDTYQTIDQPYQGTYKDKGSKFLSFAYPIHSEDEVRIILTKLKKEHFSARHHCFAWSIGINQLQYRFNDDGEPSGTAGRPIYGQIQSKGLTNILVVVVRYFGGTLLGVSGLIQAYKSAARDVISNSTIVIKTIELKLEIFFDYLAMNDLMGLLKEEQIEIIQSRYEIKCLILVKIPLSRMNQIEARLSNISGVDKFRVLT